MKIFKPLDPAIIKDSANAVFQKLGIEILDISYLGQGEGSGVFKITTPEKTYCLKTALFEKRSQKVLNEANIRNRFIEYGLDCVPSPVHVDQEFFKNGAVIYDYIEGKTPKLDNPEDVEQLARNVAQIHSIDYQIKDDGFEQAMNNYHALQKTMHHIERDYPHLINPTISAAFNQALQEYKVSVEKNSEIFPYGIWGLTHGDLFNNYITDPDGKLWLIDWENSEHWDLLEEVCTFIIDDEFPEAVQNQFIEVYKSHFPPAEKLNLKRIGLHYTCVMPAFNVCYGMDQMASNLKYNLDPERKLRDVIQSAKNWKNFFSEPTTTLINEGIDKLTEKLVKDYNLNL